MADNKVSGVVDTLLHTRDVLETLQVHRHQDGPLWDAVDALMEQVNSILLEMNPNGDK